MCLFLFLQHFVEVSQVVGIMLIVTPAHIVILHVSIWQTIKDVDSLCVAGHHDNNALLVDGYRTMI